MSATESAIIRFLAGRAPDDKGRFLTAIQQWPDDRLEAAHDFIQWLFPLRDRSGANPDAPVLTGADIAEFRSRPELRETLRSSFVRMLRFYGFEMAGGPLCVRSANFPERSKNWLRPWNHNHLRITRILKSLMLLGLEAEAQAFFACLKDVYDEGGNSISGETFAFWQSASGR